MENKRQLEIALQWDTIERELHDDDFWYFLTRKKAEAYATRIELVFDFFASNRSNQSGVLILFRRKRKQMLRVAACRRATLWFKPFLNEGRVSVSIPMIGCRSRTSTARRAEAAVFTTTMRPVNCTRGNAAILLLSNASYNATGCSNA